MASLTREATWVVELETHARHLVNLITKASRDDSWEDDLSENLKVLQQNSIETGWLEDSTLVLVYDRTINYGELALGGSHKTSDVSLTIDLQSGNKADFNEVMRKVELLLWVNNSTFAEIINNRNEWRRRLIVNNSNNLSDEKSRMFRKIIDVTMATYKEIT